LIKQDFPTSGSPMLSIFIDISLRDWGAYGPALGAFEAPGGALVGAAGFLGSAGAEDFFGAVFL
jgi:hypothetical protein